MKQYTECVIFDVDGTLLNCDHRRHWLLHKPRNWAAFNAAILDDEPIEEICRVARMFNQMNMPIVIVTARAEDVREETEYCLREKAKISWNAMYMRPTGDYDDDSNVKEAMLDRLLLDGYKPWLVFDDRDRVVEMWRMRGYRTCQVDYGAF